MDAMYDAPQVADLVARAGNGDQRAWDALVERYAPLLWSICRRHGISGADAEDVAQSVWLRLVDQLKRLRDPAALPGWLATTTRRECLRIHSTGCRRPLAGPLLDAENIRDDQIADVDDELLSQERDAVLRAAFTRLPPSCRRLLAMLIADSPAPYAEISERLGISIGSIGPNRGRCLERLRRDPAIAALLDAKVHSVTN